MPRLGCTVRRADRSCNVHGRVSRLESALVVAVALWPLDVCAQDAVEQLPQIVVEGSAVARNAEISIRCTRHDDVSTQCRVTLRADLQAGESGARLCGGSCESPIPTALGFRIAVDGELQTRIASISPGRLVTVEISYDTELSVARGWGTLVSQPALGLRHLLLGESWLWYASAAAVDVPAPLAPGLALEGGMVTVEVTSPERIRVRVDGAPLHTNRAQLAQLPRVRVSLLPPHGGQPEGPLANGGPAVVLGGRIQPGAPGARFLLGVGYELGLFEYIVLAAWFETDFESISEALLVEVALPSAIFVVPSLSVGIGIVGSELGPQHSEAALRIRLGAATWAVGFVADLDYHPAYGAWTAMMAGRVGL